MSTKITGFVLAGLLLTVNLALVIMSTVVEPENMTDGMNMTNIITIALYALMSTVWLWIAKTQCDGTARKATALSVTATLIFLALIKSVNALQYQNYKFYDSGTTYIDAVVIIVALFMLLPWIMLQLINLSWPKNASVVRGRTAGHRDVWLHGVAAIHERLMGAQKHHRQFYSFSNTSDEEEEADSVAVYTEDIDSLVDYEVHRAELYWRRLRYVLSNIESHFHTNRADFPQAGPVAFILTPHVFFLNLEHLLTHRPHYKSKLGKHSSV